MRSVVLAHEVDWGGWRDAARRLALDGVPPDDVVWSVREPDNLFGQEADAPRPAPSGAFTVPRALVALAETVIQAREPERFALLYRLISRAHAGERHVLEQTTDPEVHRANRMAQAVRRDTHKMRAFVRFREVNEAGAVRHVAWFEPAHFVVEANAAFFVRRFATMTWSILTPYRSAHWNGVETSFGPGASAADVPDDDKLAEYWRVYFSSIFNPARLKVSAMTSEMPRKYWKNLPEAAAIPELIRAAQGRVDAMVETPVISAPKPTNRFATAPVARPNSPLARAAAEASECRRCKLWEPATQTVFGEGPPDAPIMMIGEQPGDNEDLAGRPFVGPAGQLLDRALGEAGIDRALVYVTNAVKHFKFEPRGKRRIHAKPDAGEIAACRFWLDIERAELAPKVTLLLGATAARAVLGRAVTISRERSRPFRLDGSTGFVTVHPSYLLRLPDEEAKMREYAAFVADLRGSGGVAEGAVIPHEAEAFVRANTVLSTAPLVPEIELLLATEITPIWRATEIWLAETDTEPPFWAFAWPGSQALARHVLDHPGLVRGLRVLDFAAGGGLAAIACVRAGAASVEAAEIDPLAAAAIRLNARANGLELAALAADVVGQACRWDVILCGDICYEAPMTGHVMPWLSAMSATALVLIADPGRAYLPSAGLSELARFLVPTTVELEDRTERLVTLWRIAPEA